MTMLEYRRAMSGEVVSTISGGHSPGINKYTQKGTDDVISDSELNIVP
jgi:hypothetical protein